VEELIKKIEFVVSDTEKSLSYGKKYLQDIASIKRKYDKIQIEQNDFLEKRFSESPSFNRRTVTNEELLRDIELYCGLENVIISSKSHLNNFFNYF
jgi:hypothetical protein